MLKIRMQRTGRKNDPSFRVVVAEHTRSPKAGNFLERLGSYNPKSKERILNAERITYWMSKGAQASGTMHNMLISAGIITGKKVNVLPKKTPIVKESQEPVAGSQQPEEAATEAEALAEETPSSEAPTTEEAPTEEAPAEEPAPEEEKPTV